MNKPTVIIWVLALKIASAIHVTLPDGTIEGISDKTINGIQYHGFLALRFAEPPIGNLRLQPPQPVQPWEGIYNGTVETTMCYQLYEDSAKESEDCLSLNVFTPKDLTNSSFAADLAVMVWIHGGGFISGAAFMNDAGVGPKFFMDANIVFVAINYRLGPFGFTSSGDEIIPGNLGLKDQVLALKWVQKNIAYFGGDPDKVTIFGQSAGSASVSYQLLSPLSKGLFRGAILESGSAISPWAYQRNETNITFKLAQKIDPEFTSTNSSKLLAFLQSVPATAIDNASRALATELESPADYQISKGFFFAPVIEVPHENAFLTERMYGLFEDGNYNKVPIFMGMTNEESLGLLENGDLSGLWKAYDQQPEIMVPFDLHITDLELRKSLGAKIRKHFAGTEGFNNDTAKGIRTYLALFFIIPLMEEGVDSSQILDSVAREFTRIFKDLLVSAKKYNNIKDPDFLSEYHSVHDFDKANIKQAELMSKHSLVYFYQFSYKGEMGYYTYNVPGAGNVTHAEEVNYFFSKWYSPEVPDNTNMSYFPVSDQNVHYRIMALWTDFAKYLNPTPLGIDEEILEHVTWEPVEPNAFKYLDIGEDLVMRSGYPKSDSYLFWTNIYEQYTVLPLETF